MFDPEDNALEYFGADMSEPLLDFLSGGGVKQQIVGQAEVIPCLASKVIWKDRMVGRPVVHFVDNEAARFALIKGGSPTIDSAWITSEFWNHEVGQSAHTWFERVPSPSNISDAPSRGKSPITIVLSEKLKLVPVRVSLPDNFESDMLTMWHDKLRPWQ